MKIFALVFCLLLVVLLVRDVYGQLDKETEGKLVNIVMNRIGKKKTSGKFDLLDYTCQYQVTRHIKFFKFRYDAKVNCPGLSKKAGKSPQKKHRSQALESAIRDVLYQASKYGDLDYYKVRKFIKKYKG